MILFLTNQVPRVNFIAGDSTQNRVYPNDIFFLKRLSAAQPVPTLCLFNCVDPPSPPLSQVSLVQVHSHFLSKL